MTCRVKIALKLVQFDKVQEWSGTEGYTIVSQKRTRPALLHFYCRYTLVFPFLSVCSALNSATEIRQD